MIYSFLFDISRCVAFRWFRRISLPSIQCFTSEQELSVLKRFPQTQILSQKYTKHDFPVCKKKKRFTRVHLCVLLCFTSFVESCTTGDHTNPFNQIPHGFRSSPPRCTIENLITSNKTLKLNDKTSSRQSALNAYWIFSRNDGPILGPYGPVWAHTGPYELMCTNYAHLLPKQKQIGF